MNSCPNCNHDLVNIIYGIPSEKLIQMARDEGVALGGTTLVLDQPKLYCYGCNETFQ